LTAKCPIRYGNLNPVTVVTDHEKPPPQTYYLGPPPGIESNPLDFEVCATEEQCVEQEGVPEAVQSFAQGNQTANEVTVLLNQFLHNNGQKYTTRMHHQATALSQSNHPVSNKTWNTSRRCIDYTKADRWDFRKRKTPMPAHSGV